jgi:hypothetical protein
MQLLRKLLHGPDCSNPCTIHGFNLPLWVNALVTQFSDKLLTHLLPVQVSHADSQLIAFNFRRFKTANVLSKFCYVRHIKIDQHIACRFQAGPDALQRLVQVLVTREQRDAAVGNVD